MGNCYRKIAVTNAQSVCRQCLLQIANQHRHSIADLPCFQPVLNIKPRRVSSHIVTHMPIARQRLGKNILEAYALNNRRTPIAR
jgi:hypothetical protein